MEDNNPVTATARQSPRQKQTGEIVIPNDDISVSGKIPLEKVETIFEHNLKPISEGFQQEKVQNEPKPSSNLAAGDALLNIESDDEVFFDLPDYPEGVEGIDKAKSDIHDIVSYLHEKNELVDIGFPIKLPAIAPEKVKLPKRLITPRTGKKITTLPPLSAQFSHPGNKKEMSSLYNLRSPRPRTSFTKGAISLPTIPEHVKMDDAKIVVRKAAMSSSDSNAKEVGEDQTHGSLETELIMAASQDKTDKETTLYSESWKSDLTRVSSIRWNSSKTISREISPENLSLRYKRPEWPHQKPLYQTLSQTPQLTCLILDRSEIISLRELGSTLPALITLSIANCGVTSLDGTYAFPNLRTLIAPDNKLENASQCAYLEMLQHLDLCANPIDSYEGFVHLSLCISLRSLHLNGAPICKRDDFHVKMKKLIPQIKELYPVGQRDYMEDETADLEAFLQRNKKLIGSSYESVVKSKSAKRKKKKETAEMEETYKNPLPQISSESDIQISQPLKVENDISSVGAVKTSSVTSLGSVSSFASVVEIKNDSTYEEYFTQGTQDD